MFKKLIFGKFSLAKTFWLFGVLGAILLGSIGVIVVKTSINALYVILFFRFILSLLVFSGITFILRNKKITILGVVAWLIFLIQSLVLMSFMFQLIFGLIKSL